MKNALFVVAMFGLLLVGFTFGLGLGADNWRLVEAVYQYTMGIWVPLALLVLATASYVFAYRAEKSTAARRFKTWCSSGINSAEDDRQVAIYLEAIIVSLDGRIIDHEDVSDIFQKCASSEDQHKKLRIKLAELIQDRLHRGAWKLKGADGNRRRLIENFAYYRA